MQDDHFEQSRQHAIDRLTQAFASDGLSMEEYERRVELASLATRLDDLDRATDNLPATFRLDNSTRATDGVRRYGHQTGNDNPSGDRLAATQGYSAGGMPATGSPTMTVAAIMSERDMSGDWLSGNGVSAFAVMGSAKLDLRDSPLPPGPIRIEAYALMGEIKIIVPKDVPVRMGAVAFMGESRAGRDVRQQTNGARTWVDISGMALMGSVVVRAG